MDAFMKEIGDMMNILFYGICNWNFFDLKLTKRLKKSVYNK
jgi:hypothetical protein